MLLSKGAEVDAQSSENNMTALSWAVYRKHPDIFNRLLAAGANPRPLFLNQQTLLHLAASAGLADVVQTLLRLGLPADALDIYNETALIKAAENGHADVVRLLSGFPSRSHWNADKETALTLASTNGHLEVVKAMLDAGAPLIGEEGDKAITNAVEAKQLALTETLLNRGANVNASGFLGRPLISLAAWVNQTKLALLLLTHRADPKLKSESGQTPLQMATQWTDFPALIDALLKAGAPEDADAMLNACGKQGPEMLVV